MSPLPAKWRPHTIGGMTYLVVVAVAIAGLVLVATYEWRTGICILGVGMLIGAVSRFCLGEYDSGMLRVRSKPFDVAAMTALGVVMIVLALVIPDQRV